MSVRIASGLALLAGLTLVGCESDVLTPTGGFQPTECETEENCNTGKRLDGGFVSLDSGVHPDADPIPFDAGDAGVGIDAGLWPDAAPPDVGFPDAGFPDTGPVDTGVPPPVFLNVSGNYNTRYELDLSNFLFGLSGLASPLDWLDNLIDGNVDTGFPPLDLVVRNFIDNNVPQWVRNGISVLADLATFFDRVTTTGMMTVVQDPPVGTEAALTATEQWDAALVYIRGRCPLGRLDPAWPGCAQQLIDLDAPNALPCPRPGGAIAIAVDVHNDFYGTLQAGAPQAAVAFTDRDVDIDLFGLVLIMIDFAIEEATNGQASSLNDLIAQVIPCSQLEQVVEDWLVANTGQPRLTARVLARNIVGDLCRDFVTDVQTQFCQAFSGIGVGIASMTFDHFGTAVDNNGNGRPETLQTLPPNLTSNPLPPRTVDGRFRVVLPRDSMSGWWQAISTSP